MNNHVDSGDVLDPAFFARPTRRVASELLGMYLVRERDDSVAAYMVTEVEAYDGPHDKASHASRGRTARTEVMFGPAGHWYVYLCYGMHWMLNVVTGPTDYPAAVLIRGVVGIEGPGRVTKALAVDRAQNTLPAARRSGLWFEDRGIRVSRRSIVTTPRVGVAYAGEWAHKPWRYVLSGGS